MAHLSDLIPSLVSLGGAVWFIRAHRGRTVVQIYVAIVASYLNVFPALDYLFADGAEMEAFAAFQLLIIGFFEIPLLIVLHGAVHGTQPSVLAMYAKSPRQWVGVRLSPLLPILLALALFIFWYVALDYELFFRRLGHEGLERKSAEVPGALLYIYRGAVETAFFVVVVLMSALRLAPRGSRYQFGYKIVLGSYLATFLVFFGANSRMQFMLLLFCLICTQPKFANFFLNRVKVGRLTILVFAFVVSLTLLRELYLEDNARVSTDDLPSLLKSVGWLISARLDSVVILSRLQAAGFNPWAFDFTGTSHLFKFYSAFLLDPETFARIKGSLVTSPTVAIVNHLLSTSEVDFPKSMILDMFLSFGVFGLLVTALALGAVVGTIQERILKFRDFRPPYLLAVYVLPMIFEFEKEFLGLVFAFIKWSPVFWLVYLLRPRVIAGVAASDRRTLPVLASGSDEAVSVGVGEP